MKAVPGSELMTIHLCQPLRIAVKEGCRSLHPELGDNETDDGIMEIVASFRVVGVASSPDRSPHTHTPEVVALRDRINRTMSCSMFSSPPQLCKTNLTVSCLNGFL